MNNTFRLFVSSTFSDFIKERAILNKEIFEKINLLLNKKGYSFQIVDLRWGINTESALSQNTLEICLNDVKYCKKNSPKPNFLIMVGERYGWVPLPSSVKADEFERILCLCDDRQKELLCKWYSLDRNNIPEAYYLNKRTGEYVNENVWENEEKRLHDILEKKAIECGFEENELIKYTASATEHEILEGLFENDNTADNVIVLFREGYSEKDEDTSKVEALKKRIKERINEDSLSENLVTLKYGENYYREMEEKITALLVNNILKELERLETEKKEYIPERLHNEVFCGRDAELEALRGYVDSSEKGIYYLSGESGSGKTTLLKEFVHFCSSVDPEKQFDEEYSAATENSSLKEAWTAAKKYVKSKKIDSFCVFFGENEVYSIYDCLKKLCLMMTSKYNISLNNEINKFNISEIFLKVLKETPRSLKTVIIIDGLDMFYDINSVNENVFPDILPDGVKIIVSCADERILEKLKKRNDLCYRICGLSHEEAVESFYKMLEARGRKLFCEEQRKTVEQALSNGANPLSCKLLCDLAARWRDNDAVKQFAFDDYEMAKLHIFDVCKNCGHDENIVRYMLSYIAKAPFGITEDELLMLLFKHREIKENFEKEDRYGYNLSRLPFAVLTRILYDLKECIHLAKAKDSIIVSFNHNIFRIVALTEFKEECDIAQSRLLEYYSSLENYISENKYPNTKKLIPLLKMLRDKQLYAKIAELLSDITFADAMIKSGNITELCYCYEEAESIGNLDERGKALFKCIKKNIITLDCYKNGLEGCACDYGFEKADTVLGVRDFSGSDNGFGSYSQMYWSCDGEQYATVYDNYVYIYKKNSYRNYLSVHISFSDDDLGDEKVSEVVWTKENKFAVILNIGRVYIYKIENEMPKFEAELECSEDIKNVRYSCKFNYLLIIRKRKLVAVNMESYTEMYSIPNAGGGIFDINDVMERIVLLHRRNCMKLFNLCDGTFINNVPTYQSIRESTESIYLFENGTVIGIEPGYPTDIKLLTSMRKMRLRFPEQYDVKGFAKFKNSFVVYYDNIIIRADLKTLELSYVLLPDIKKVYCIGDSDSLLITTSGELRSVTEADFVPIDKKLYLSNKTIEIQRASVMYMLMDTMKMDFKSAQKRVDLKSFQAMFGRDFDSLRYESEEYAKKIRSYFDCITFMSFSDDGHAMVAKEGEGKICVFDASKKVIYRLEKIDFSADNTIIDCAFSGNSRYLYILKTDGIILIDVKKRKKICDFEFNGIPPKAVEFSDEGKIAFVLDERHEFPIRKNLKKRYRRIAVKKYSKEEFEGFVNRCLTGAYVAEKFLTDVLCENDIVHNYKSIYRLNGDMLVYEGGTFFINGNRADNAFCDFSSALRDELNKEQTTFSKFMKIKNDINSKVIKKGNMLILVSFALNSVIAFDTEKCAVTEARKFGGKILGTKETANGIELYTDNYPYKSMVEIEM